MFVNAGRVPAPPVPPGPPEAGAVRIVTAHDFVWRNGLGHYDLPVYQVGNSHLHRFIWPYLFHFPGLAVLHDARVHHARAEALISRNREHDYRAEFAWSHPGVDAGAADLAILGIEGAFLFLWPMIRGVVESARLVGAHSRGVAEQMAREYPHRPIEHIALGEGPASMDVADARRSFRRAHGLDETAPVFGVHGSLTADKRIPDVLAAFAATLPWVPNARLLLAGQVDYSLDLASRIVRLGLEKAVVQVDRLDQVEFDRAIAACDVTLSLRWPSALETSGPWVRSLAMGRATIVIDLPHTTHVPTLDPRTWRRHAPCPDLDPQADDRAVAVAIDVRDLAHSLVLAMRRLAADPQLGARLGANARAWWEREHTMDRMVDDYERAIARAITLPAPAPDWPAHMRPDPATHARDLVAGRTWGDPLARGALAGL